MESENGSLGTKLEVKTKGKLSDDNPVLNLSLLQPRILEGQCTISGKVRIDND